MASVNKVILVGNLGKDTEVRVTNSGQKIAHLSVATSDSWKDKQGNKQERTEWHKVVIFSPALVDFSEKYLKKGSKVYLEGSIQTRKYTDSTGQERYTNEVVLSPFKSTLVLLDSQNKGASQPEEASPSSGWDDDGFNDEIPF